jgi:tetratricopeptide (TPR) repeat protein
MSEPCKRIRGFFIKTVCLFLVVPLCLWGLFSCSLLGKTEKGKEGTSAGIAVDEDGGRKEPKYPERDKTEKRDEQAERRQKVNELLEKKKYLLALNVINRERREGFEPEYLVAIKGLIALGEESLLKENYEEAGITFRRVLENYPGKPLQAKIERSRDWIKSWLRIFSEKLMVQGLSEYREGSLSMVIEIWKKILRFNPDYPPAKKAIETATAQLKNLKSLEEKTR